MNRLALFFLALFLTACSVTTTPAPRPVLTLTRPDAQHVSATLIPAPAAARWTLRHADECGAEDGPAISGEWDTSSPLLLDATSSDLLSVTFLDEEGQEISVQDCIPIYSDFLRGSPDT